MDPKIRQFSSNKAGIGDECANIIIIGMTAIDRFFESKPKETMTFLTIEIGG